jgi:hypothetical protein
VRRSLCEALRGSLAAGSLDGFIVCEDGDTDDGAW